MAVPGARGFALAATAALLVVLFVPAARAEDVRPEPLQTGADWPMYGRSAAHNFSTGATPPAALGLKWSFEGNGTVGSAVLMGDHVYVADLDTTAPPAGPNLVVHKLHQVNGSNRPIVDVNGWGRRVPIVNATALAPPRSLAVDASRVYALWTVDLVGGTDHQEILAALDAGTGQILWTFNGTSPWSAGVAAATRSAPLLAGGLVLFGSQDGNVYAVNAATGALVWWFPSNGPLTTVPAVFGTIAYVTSGTDLIYLDIVGISDNDDGTPEAGGWTGDELFRVTVGTTIAASPVIEDPFVYVDAGGDLYAFDRSNGGAPVWSRATGQQTEGTPAVYGAWILARRSDGSLHAYDRVSGELVWVRPGLSGVPNAEDVAAADGRVFLSAIRGGSYDLVTVDAADGSVLDANSTSGRTTLGTPIVAGDKVFVGEGSRLLAFRGQPDLAVDVSDVTPRLSQAVGGVAVGHLTVRIRNGGTEPVWGVRVRVYDGPYDPLNPDQNQIGDFIVGNESAPLSDGGLSAGNDTADRDWTVGTHTVRVVIDGVPPETNVANNQVVVLIAVAAGPSPPPAVVGAGPYWAALLLGFAAGAAILYVPLRRLRDLRRKEPEEKTP